MRSVDLLAYLSLKHLSNRTVTCFYFVRIRSGNHIFSEVQLLCDERTDGRTDGKKRTGDVEV